MARKRSSALFIGALALLCLLLLLLKGAGNSTRSVQKLRDGSLLRLGKVSFGGGSQTFRPVVVTGWRAKAAAVLPNAWTMRLGWLESGGRLTMQYPQNSTNLGAFPICQVVTNTRRGDIHRVIRD